MDDAHEDDAVVVDDEIDYAARVEVSQRGEKRDRRRGKKGGCEECPSSQLGEIVVVVVVVATAAAVGREEFDCRQTWRGKRTARMIKTMTKKTKTVTAIGRTKAMVVVVVVVVAVIATPGLLVRRRTRGTEAGHDQGDVVVGLRYCVFDSSSSSRPLRKNADRRRPASN